MRGFAVGAVLLLSVLAAGCSGSGSTEVASGAPTPVVTTPPLGMPRDLPTPVPTIGPEGVPTTAPLIAPAPTPLPDDVALATAAPELADPDADAAQPQIPATVSPEPATPVPTPPATTAPAAAAPATSAAEPTAPPATAVPANGAPQPPNDEGSTTADEPGVESPTVVATVTPTPRPRSPDGATIALVDVPVVNLFSGETESLAQFSPSGPTLLFFWAPH